MSDCEAYSPLVDPLESDRLLKDAWVDAYLKDFNAVQACHRIGIPKDQIGATNTRFSEDPYVIDQVREKMRTMDESTVVTRSEILNHIKRIAISSTNEDQRFKAWGKLAKLMGMEVLHVKTERVGGDNLPAVDEDMDAQALAEIYANEVLDE